MLSVTFIESPRIVKETVIVTRYAVRSPKVTGGSTRRRD